MQLAIFGATGGTGRHLVEQALAACHEVTVLVRNPYAVTVKHERLRLVQGDARDPQQVAAMIANQDAVLSAIGTNARGPVTICAESMAHILTAMTQRGVPRLIALSAYGAADSHDGGLYTRLVWLLQKYKMADKERMEALVRNTALDWTLVRPPALTNGRRTQRYHAGTGLRMKVTSHISRADVADFMLRQVTEPTYIRQAPSIAA